MSDDPLYLSFKTHKNYLIVPRGFIRELGPSKAIVLTELLCKEYFLKSKNLLPQDSWFFFKLGEISQNTGISVNQISVYLKEFATVPPDDEAEAKEGLISVKKGSGGKNFYRLNRKAVEKLFQPGDNPNSGIPESGNGDSQKVGNSTHEKQESILDNDVIKKDRRISSYCNAPDGALGDEASQNTDFQTSFSGKRPGKKEGKAVKDEGRRARRALRPEVRELILEVLPLGEFTNRPPEEGKPVSQLYLYVQKFLTLLANPAEFTRAYEFDPEWLRKSNIDPKDFKDKALEPRVRRAAKRFAQMRKEGYEPQNKSVLTPYIQNFFYNTVVHKSWFLYCHFNEPQTVAQGNASRAVATLSEEERELALKHRPEGWDESQYLAKAADLFAWYKEFGEGARVFNFFIRDSIQPWRDHFGDFESLLETIDEYARGWSDWKLGNFGRGNRTWVRFLDWCRKRYNVELEPPPNRVKEALEMQRQSLKESDEREREYAEEEEEFRREMLGEEDDVEE